MIADKYVSVDQGSGALKVTPAHDINDFDIGKRHKLEFINIFEKIGLKTSSNILSYIKPSKIENILKAANYQKIKNYNRVFVPFKLFGLGKIINYM